MAHEIWGKDISALKGKTARSKPTHVAGDIVKIIREYKLLLKSVFIKADIFFVNGAPLFTTLSRKIDFLGISHLIGRKVQNIFQAYKSLHRYYLRRGFRITTLHADGEFVPLKELIEGMPGGPYINLTGANEHVPEIERGIRVVKERSRDLRHNLPYNKIPLIMTIRGILVIARMLNQFPTKNGISNTFSPKIILSRESLD